MLRPSLPQGRKRSNGMIAPGIAALRPRPRGRPSMQPVQQEMKGGQKGNEESSSDDDKEELDEEREREDMAVFVARHSQAYDAFALNLATAQGRR